MQALRPLFQGALLEGREPRPRERAFVEGIDPVLSVYRVDTEAVSAWKEQAPEALRLRNVLNPIAWLEQMALVEWTHEMMPLATAEATESMDIVSHDHYFVAAFNPDKAARLRQAFELARRLQRETDEKILEDFYKSLDQRPPIAEVVSSPHRQNIFKRAWRWLLGLWGMNLGAATLGSPSAGSAHAIGLHAAAFVVVLASFYFMPGIWRFLSAGARDVGENFKTTMAHADRFIRAFQSAA